MSNRQRPEFARSKAGAFAQLAFFLRNLNNSAIFTVWACFNKVCY